MLIQQILSLLVIFIVAASLGATPIQKLIQIQEANHELKRGSPGFIRTMRGWFIIAVWGFAAWYFASIIGDWWASGDLRGAIDRSWIRLRIVIEILAAIGND